MRKFVGILHISSEIQPKISSKQSGIILKYMKNRVGSAFSCGIKEVYSPSMSRSLFIL